MSPDTLIAPDVAVTRPTRAQATCQCPLTQEWDSAATPWSQAFAANA